MNVHNYILWKQFASAIIEFDSVMKFFYLVAFIWTEHKTIIQTWLESTRCRTSAVKIQSKLRAQVKEKPLK